MNVFRHKPIHIATLMMLICGTVFHLAEAEDSLWVCVMSSRFYHHQDGRDLDRIPFYSRPFTLPIAGYRLDNIDHLGILERSFHAFATSLDRGLDYEVGTDCYYNFPDEDMDEFHLRIGITGPKFGTSQEINWVPGPDLIAQVLKAVGAVQSRHRTAVTPAQAANNLFGPRARDAAKTWMERNDIAPPAEADSTLALMVQTALALQNFDPGPKDGKIGRKTLAAIAAWQAIVGLLAGADLADVLAAILHTAMTLQGLDPGPVDTMFGQDALKTVAAWQTAHGSTLEQAQKVQPGYGEESDDRLLSSSWRRVPDALACVSIDYSERRFTQYIVNHCDHPVRVEWCYVGKTGDRGQWQCDPGPPGLGFMDRVGHRATRKGVGVPDYYTSGAGLRAKPGGDRVQGHDHWPMPEVGRVRYIACGYDHIAGVRHYDMEWDAHTGQFRCLAYFVPDGPGGPPEAGVQ